MILYRIKSTDTNLYWLIPHSIQPVWDNTGYFFTKEQLCDLLKQFKYQRKLWPGNLEIEQYTVSDPVTSTIDKEVFDELDLDLTHEKLKGSRY